ncbi:hypothetical protein BCV70DRAFT_102906 [Testicularia cyperi]|uniref:Uncharacterized protein n=1 Tax=Testicularia cyperi TaxID=1882483 RepID=A0A317XQ61_9BASI|nr:hypothetical protein BCV70DRAFT_102906 [Testicularia cyperi]
MRVRPALCHASNRTYPYRRWLWNHQIVPRASPSLRRFIYLRPLRLDEFEKSKRHLRRCALVSESNVQNIRQVCADARCVVSQTKSAASRYQDNRSRYSRFSVVRKEAVCFKTYGAVHAFEAATCFVLHGAVKASGITTTAFPPLRWRTLQATT